MHKKICIGSRQRAARKSQLRSLIWFAKQVLQVLGDNFHLEQSETEEGPCLQSWWKTQKQKQKKDFAQADSERKELTI